MTKRLGIQATFGKSLKDVCYIVLHCFKCNINCSKGMSNIVKDFKYSRKLCNVVNLKLKLNTVLQISVFISSKRVQVQGKTNIPQLMEYGNFSVRPYQHQSNVSLKNYCHLGLLLHLHNRPF